jgi:hypothetical protein
MITISKIYKSHKTMYFSLGVIEKIEAELGSFVVDRVIGGSNDTQLIRFGGWNRVDFNKLQEIVGDEAVIVENELDDDGRKTLYSYKFYKK